MADLETSLRTLTLQNASVAAAFGNRFYWNHVPDTVTYPIIKAQTITDGRRDTHARTSGGQMLVQLDVYDDDKTNSNTGAELIRSWLHRYNGTMGNYNVTIKVRNMPSFWDTDARLFRRLMEVDVLYFGTF